MKIHRRLLRVLPLPFFIFTASSLVATQGALAAIDHSVARTRTYADVRAVLKETAKEFPQNAKVFKLGDSDGGAEIEGLAIGSGPISNLVVGTHHGNEYGSSEVALATLYSLAQNPILGQTVYVIPVLNVGGYEGRKRWERAGGISYDPNRNYPGPCGTEGPFTLKSTIALAKFIESRNIVTSATLHTFYPAVVYPWGLSSRDLTTPQEDLFKELTRLAAIESGYETGNSTQVIYPADGTYEDYAYWQHGIWSILFELGFSHSPSPDDVRTMAQVNVPGIRRLLEQAPRQRAERHSFDGRCDGALRILDRHDE